jgi:hypothetical protein
MCYRSNTRAIKITASPQIAKTAVKPPTSRVVGAPGGRTEFTRIHIELQRKEFGEYELEPNTHGSG